MPLIHGTIPNLINGVSQQPDGLRLASQCEEQVNAFSSVVEGLQKRSPTEYVAKLISGTLGETAFVHTITRDSDERYIVVLTDGTVQVFNALTGAEQTMNDYDGDPAGTDYTPYLASTNPRADFRAVTIADTTVIVNRTVETEMDDTNKSAAAVNQALFWVKQGNHSQTYTVTIDGVANSHQVPDTGTPAATNTETIAAALKTLIDADIGGTLHANFVCTRRGSTLHLKRSDNAAFTILGEDSYGNSASSTVKDSVQSFSDLPNVAMPNMVVEITGTENTGFDNYFVKFVSTNGVATMDDGTWEETVQPATEIDFEESTMPHQLVRESDGTWTLSYIEWGSRICGDTDISPDPSFIGTEINDVFFFKNRLGFLSDENVVMSRAGEFWEYFRETALDLLDSDPIDVAVSYTKVSILEHAIPFDEKLLLFSDQTQFVLDGGDLLTPRTASISQTTSFESQLQAKPVNAGSNVFFATDRGDYAGVREYYINPQTDAHDAADVTAHAPKYLVGDVVKFAASTNEDVLCVLTDGYDEGIYIYKFYWDGDQKLQSSWSKFYFGASAEVLNVDFIGSNIVLVIQREDGVYLETLDVTPGQIDANGAYLTHLDRRITEDDCDTVEYAAGTGNTTFTLPYEFSGDTDDIVVVTRATVSDDGGVVLTKVSATGTTIVVSGDHSSSDVWIGIPYEMRYTFSSLSLREQAQGSAGGQIVVLDGRIQVRRFSVSYADTGYFRAEVTPLHRDTSSYVFSGRVIGSGNNLIGSVGLETGIKRFPVMSKSDRVTIELVNDTHLPCHFQSAMWEGMYVSITRR